MGLCWLQSARLARKEKLTQTAFSAILQAAPCNPPGLVLEKARLRWAQGQQHEALIGLQSDVEQVLHSPEHANERTEAKLLIGHWVRRKKEEEEEEEEEEEGERGEEGGGGERERDREKKRETLLPLEVVPSVLFFSSLFSFCPSAFANKLLPVFSCSSFFFFFNR